LLLDGFDQTFAEFLAVHEEDGLAAVEEELEVRALLGTGRYALPGQPAQKLRTLHNLIVYIFVYPRKRDVPDFRNHAVAQKKQPTEVDCPF